MRLIWFISKSQSRNSQSKVTPFDDILVIVGEVYDLSFILYKLLFVGNFIFSLYFYTLNQYFSIHVSKSFYWTSCNFLTTVLTSMSKS